MTNLSSLSDARATTLTLLALFVASASNGHDSIEASTTVGRRLDDASDLIPTTGPAKGTTNTRP